jgi:hypothetical protein
MHAAMTEGHLAFTGMTRNDWLTLANNGALQRNCNSMGYNSAPSNAYQNTFHLRIGIVANEQHDCDSPNSFIGFGACKFYFFNDQFHTYPNLSAKERGILYSSVGNAAPNIDGGLNYRADGTGVSTFDEPAFGYILVR